MAAEKPRVIARRPDTPPPGARDSRISSRLPDDLVAEQVKRLETFCAVAAGMWAFGFLMDSLIVPGTLGTPVNQRSLVVESVFVLASIVMCLGVRFGKHTIQASPEVGLAIMVPNAFGVAMLNTWATTPTIDTMNRLSWVTIVILVSSMIMPAPPRRMLVAAFVAASMDPLGVWLAHLRGLAVPSIASTFVLFLPNYVCAVVATVPSSLVHRLGRRLREARDLGSYHLVERLGAGGMGEVWRAEHQLLARTAAVKVVRAEVLGAGSEADSKTVLRRFEREAQATAALSSPHTVNLFDFGITDDGAFYYVMELLAGRDLESLIRDFGPVPADRAMFLLRQICHSLAEAHARGLVHRDVKPANIYICRMGLEYDFVKVLDFGLVRFGGRRSMQETLTADHVTTGTPAYMAPEIILGEADIDRRADVYAVGCVAYYMLTGQLVFEADTTMKMMMQHVQAAPIPPSQRTELPVPPELDGLVLACLEKDPAKRPQNAEELFQIACGCRSCESWTQARARTWWERHLPEFAGPLTITYPESRARDVEAVP